MKYFNFNENKHAPEQFGSDADLKGYEIESVLLGGRLCKPAFGLEHLMFIQVIGESKHPITKKTKDIHSNALIAIRLTPLITYQNKPLAKSHIIPQPLLNITLTV